MTSQVRKRSIPSGALPWINEPGLVLLAYLVVTGLVARPGSSLLQLALASALALFGSGYSFVTAVFPEPGRLDFVERLGLAAMLSLAVGGLSGFLLTQTPWGLKVTPFLIVTFLFNGVCYLLVVQRRASTYSSPVVEAYEALSNWWEGQAVEARLVTLILLALLVGGAWTMRYTALAVDAEPAMTEFFLLNGSGLAEDYPQRVVAGESLQIGYGIVNREKEPARYQVKVVAGGQLLASTEATRLAPGARMEEKLSVPFPDSVAGRTRVSFFLYRGESDGPLYRDRALHLPVTVVLANAPDLPNSVTQPGEA